MRRFGVTLLLFSLGVTTARAQDALTLEQRIADLNQLASQYAKNYGPYEWKRDVQGFDLLRLTPWLHRIQHADDLDFQEALIEYVASLNDAHDSIAFPTTFSASLPMSVDIYDGKVLIDSINRVRLPVAQFPFVIGDELVSLDGRPVQELIESFRKYAIAANPRSTDRNAATRLVSRSQQVMPHAYQVGDTATVAVRLAATGATNTYTIPWLKNGIPMLSQGPLPSPVRGNGRLFLSTDGQDINAGLPGSAAATASLFKIADAGPADNTLPAYMDPIRPLLNVSVPADYYSILGFGSRFPVYALPAGFTDLGSTSCATCIVRPGEPLFYFVGTFTTAGGVRVGFLRIPSMSPPNSAIALAQLDRAMSVFATSTDGLIVDVMRNPGGSVAFVEAVSQRLIPAPFTTIGFEIRATASWLFSFAAQLSNARLNPATPPAVLANLEANFNEVLKAFNENRGRSAPVSLNSTGSLELQPVGAYVKPIMMLTDEFSASGGDMLPAIFQTNHRGPVFGWRTMGAGGSVVSFSGPAFTESIFRITVSLMNRGQVVTTPDFPPAPYVENIGVRPDIAVDYMTRANLLSGGAAFVQAFTQAIENLVHSSSH
jgi:hypothetical protein